MKLLAVVLALPFLGVALLVFAVATVLSGPAPADLAPCSSASGAQAGAGSASQKQNLDTILGQVKAYGLPQQAAIDAVTAGLAESGLNNYETADGRPIPTNLDSVGVFQERPSQGWGTPQQILDVRYATDRWLQYMEANVPGWPDMAPAAVAQAVERSADPQRYAQFVPQATAWVGRDWNGTPAAPPVLPPPTASPASSPSPAGASLTSASSSCSAPALTSSLTASQEGGLWPVQLPVPAPGWEQPIALPRWPSSEAASPPTAVSNQCVAGAEWAYDAMHSSTYRFPSANGVDVARQAAAHGLQASAVPVVGDVVSFTIPGSSPGHVALVIATSPAAFEVVEQNWLQDNPYQPQWSATDWDIRSVAWPNNSVTGFAGPPTAQAG